MKSTRAAEIQQELQDLKKELKEIQLEGKPLILELANRLYQEIVTQGYNPGINVDIWKPEGRPLHVTLIVGEKLVYIREGENKNGY